APRLRAAGVRAYRRLPAESGACPPRTLPAAETVARTPTIETEGLRGGVVYHDGQFDDARLLIHLALTAAEQGATLLNYVAVTGLVRNGSGVVAGAVARDAEAGRAWERPARAVGTATGAVYAAVRAL